MIKLIAKAAVFSIFLIGASGCALPYAIAGPADVDAKFKPNGKEPMLVLVENYSGSGQMNQDADNLNTVLYNEMKEHKIAPLVDPNSIEQLKDAKKDKYRLMGISDIGAAVGAKQVLYVKVVRADFDIPSGSGEMEVRVRVVDSQSGVTKWPETDDGEQLTVTTPVINRESPAADQQVHKDMASKMGVKIGNLFHDWKPDRELQEHTEATGLASGPN